MVPPPAGAPAPGELSEPFEVSEGALVERLQRRVAALERQLEARIAQVADLQARLAHEQQRRPNPEAEAQLRQRAAQYDALMATLTMRTLRRPREWYAQARRRLHR